MDPVTALIAPQALKSAIGGLQWLFGNKRANNLDRPSRYTVPAVSEAVATSRYQTQGQRPGSSLAKDQIKETQANTVSQVQKAGGTSSTAMAAALGAQNQASNALLQENVLDDQFKLNANMQFLRSLQMLAQEQGLNWRWNEAEKYMEEADAARNLQESGLQNFMGGLTEAGGLFYVNKMLNSNDPTKSPYWNAKKGYMGTAEMKEAQDKAAWNTYNNQVNPPAPAVSNPMHGKFGEGMNTTGYMQELPLMQLNDPYANLKKIFSDMLKN